jgi:SPP1 gp7 family putative phage head morphogenesis protein
VRRTQVRKLLRASPQAEETYTRALRGIVKAASIRLQNAALGGRADAANYKQAVEREFQKLKKPLSQAVEGAFQTMFTSVSKWNAKGLAAIGIALRKDVGFSKILDAALAENTQLIVETTGEIAAQVVGIMQAPENLGLRVEDLAQQIQERANVGTSRAELIARDQTLKMNSALTQSRMVSAGVESYVWSTSKDDRVREEHAALEGETFTWSDPPDVGHPGEDFQCRCVAIPVIQEFADL